MSGGELSKAVHAKRHPLDWYVDPVWCAYQLVKHLEDFRYEKVCDQAIWDPAAGLGNTIDAFVAHGFRTYLSDLVQNVDWESRDPDQWGGVLTEQERGFYRKPDFFAADFLELTEAPAPCAIVCNPPYSYKKGILEAFARHALKLATSRVCLLVPNKWLSSQSRHRLFMIDHPPTLVLHLTQRPSMPPGDRIALMGNRAFRGGMIDYCWVVWDVTYPTPAGETKVRWLPPLGGQS